VISQVRVRAHAKINWGLELLGRRPDGYHEIRTVMQTVSLHDDLMVGLSPDGVQLRVSGDFDAPRGPENICWRAAEAFRETFGRPGGACIELCKHVPAGGGLGGGSSDCVAVLAALARLTGLDGDERLREIAAQLGSDTVAFLTGGATMCSGRGEIVEPLVAGRTYDLVIARPDEGVSTPEAYQGIGHEDFSDGSGMDAVARALSSGAPPERLSELCLNAFTRSVVARMPQIGALVDWMIDLGAVGAHMTGSGSAVFGLATDAAAADGLAASLRDMGYWSVAARTVDAGYTLGENLNHE